jgi:hypothetical protein
MRYAKYPDTVYADPATPLVDAYVGYIRAYEQHIMPPDQERQRQIKELPVGDTRRSAFLIGRACLLGKKGNEVEKRLSQRAHTELTPSSKVIGNRVLAAQQRNIARLVEGRDNEVRIAQVRANLHDAAMQTLQTTSAKAMNRREGNSRQDVGARTEARVLGSLTRLKHPWLLATSALEHHDRHQINHDSGKENKQRNFDILAVESRPSDHDNPGPFVYKAQVKSHCFGLCPIPADNSLAERRAMLDTRIAARRQFAYERTLYNPDISLISACCDFKPYEDSTINGIDALLLTEYSNKASAADIAALDIVSNNVLLAITGDPSRRGTCDIETAAFAPSYQTLSV